MSRSRFLLAPSVASLVLACSDEAPTSPKDRRGGGPAFATVSTDCTNTLQSALDAAAPGEIVTIGGGLVCTGTFYLPARPITLEGGSGATFDGGGEVPILVGQDVGATTIRNLTFRNGRTTGSGGAISLGGNSAPVLVNNRFLGNTAEGDGGAISIQDLGSSGAGGSVTLSQNVFGSAAEPNTAGGQGGAVSVISANNVTLEGNSFAGNSAGIGGAFYLSVSGGVLQRNTVTGNSAASGGGATIVSNAVGGDGGAASPVQMVENIFSANTATDPSGGGGGLSAVGPVTISGSTFSSNTAGGGGGGIAFGLGSDPGTPSGGLLVSNTTISGNAAGNGGGVFMQGTKVTAGSFQNVTIAGNTATDAAATGGGLAADLENLSVVLRNTILSGNTITGAGTRNCSGGVASEGHNLEDGDSCWLGAEVQIAGDLANTNALLGELADNGGFTRTHALLAGSPALDAGDNVGCPLVDQRGQARPQGTACDIGSVEQKPATIPPSTIPADIIIVPGLPRLPIRLGDKNPAITVTLLTKGTLNAARIVPASLTLGNGQGAEAAVPTYRGKPVVTVIDVDRDGDKDLIAAFNEPALVVNGDLTTATTSLVLLGALSDGGKFRGEAVVKVVP